MTSDDDARKWLREHGYTAIAERIDELMDEWARRRVSTRRNWWDVLAGTHDGTPRVVDGEAFPILAVARRRKGWPPVAGSLQLEEHERAPRPAEHGRWGNRPKTRPANKRGRRSTTVRARQHGASARSHNSDTTEAGRGGAMQLAVRDFAQLENVSVPLRDLVVLVGPQATGKSLVLELLKLVIDRNRIVRSLKQHGFTWETGEEFAALYFGGGFERSWSKRTSITYGQEVVTLDGVASSRARKGQDAVFYIPAHRTLAIAEGWPRSFAAYQVETPYVARRFSEELLSALNQGLVGKGKIFPHDRRLKDAFRRLIDEAVFHGATLKLEKEGMRKQFVLEYERQARLPFMAWTAGQREFTPLLLGLYQLLPAGRGPKKKEISWAILEEPEMGLHPKAIVAVMAVVLDLLARGYRVALSTHSPTILEVVWGMSRLRNVRGGAAHLCRMMGLPEKDKTVLKTAERALQRSYAVVHVQHGPNGRVVSTDISKLDPGAADPSEWGWGGLTGFSANVEAAVAEARASERAAERAAE